MPTKIEWTEETWNPVTGCTPVSAGCENCYARRTAKRLAGRFGYPKDEPFRVTLHHDRLDKVPSARMVFLCSMGDLFHEAVSFEFTARVYAVMENHPQQTFQVLTKRPRQRKWFYEWVRHRQIGLSLPLPNVWEGVTAEHQKAVEERIAPHLHTPAAVHFISLEPMLGPVDLAWIKNGDSYEHDGATYTPHENALRRRREPEPGVKILVPAVPGLDWVICGGETGPGARPMRLHWVRSLRDQCQAAGVPFFFKSWGEWHSIAGGCDMHRIGHKAAGRLLDGRKWDEYPKETKR